MGESAVLVHSYSFTAPVPTHNDSHENNTLQALSESISFGKFMTENLEWGKWSTFSHKKYVEEAEKYSRPGSVAQKKAFFEAHYKRIAEAKKAAAQEQLNVAPAEVLLHTLDTQPPPPPPPPVDERSSFQIDDHAVSDSKPEVADDLTDKLEKEVVGDDEKEKKQEVELLKEDLSVDEKEKQRNSITKNRPVFRLSLEKTIPPKSVDEITLTEKISERPITQKPVPRHRFSFLSCFRGNAKTQDQNQSTKKTEKKKKKKQFMCLCLKTKAVRE